MDAADASAVLDADAPALAEDGGELSGSEDEVVDVTNEDWLVLDTVAQVLPSAFQIRVRYKDDRRVWQMSAVQFLAMLAPDPLLGGEMPARDQHFRIGVHTSWGGWSRATP